jgi:hypothetical protein
MSADSPQSPGARWAAPARSSSSPGLSASAGATWAEPAGSAASPEAAASSAQDEPATPPSASPLQPSGPDSPDSPASTAPAPARDPRSLTLRWSDEEGYALVVVHYSDRLHYSVRDDEMDEGGGGGCCSVS